LKRQLGAFSEWRYQKSFFDISESNRGTIRLAPSCGINISSC
jgi:hypothetical protein